MIEHNEDCSYIFSTDTTETLFKSLPYVPVAPTFLSNESENLNTVSNHINRLKTYNTEICEKIAEESNTIDLTINNCTATEEEELLQKYEKWTDEVTEITEENKNITYNSRCGVSCFGVKGFIILRKKFSRIWQ